MKQRKFKKKKIDVGVEIVMKDKNGEIITFDEKKAESDQSGTEDAEETRVSKIESEDTLQMIKDALKSAPKKKKKVVVTKKAKAVKTDKPKVDSIQRFLNDYGENPHL